MIVLQTPTCARLIGFCYQSKRALLEKTLSYVDGRADFELQKTTRSLSKFLKYPAFFAEKMGQEKYDLLIEEMKAKKETLKLKRKGNLLFEDQDGLWTYSGMADQLASVFDDVVERGYELPPTKLIPVVNQSKYQDRDYQQQALEALVGAADSGPCGVELPTGAGKSTIIRNLVKHYGLQVVVMAPSASIARQLYDDLLYHFGVRYVGLFGDGKKDYKKLIVVGIDDSLRNVEPGSETWKSLSKAQVFIADESHLTPAESLQKVCFGLCASAPYRFFFSATQLRNDGLGPVLDAITGKIVMRKQFRELVDAGYLAKPGFKMLRVVSDSGYESPDANKMTRNHLYYNDVVNYVAADLANRFVEFGRRPTLILVEELEQFRELLPWLKHEVKFAHGPLNKKTAELVPEAYRDDDPKELVEAFNRGEIPILVGTSCISTGTDIRVAEAGIYLQGGKSEIKVKQGSVGRMSRGGDKSSVINPWTGKPKLDAVIVDFDVINVDKVHSHALARESLYEEMYSKPTSINMTQVIVPKKPRSK